MEQQILDGLKAAARPERAEGARAYLKSQRDFLGVSVPDTRAVVRTIGKLDREPAIALAQKLWEGPWFECRQAAVMVLARSARSLEVEDLALVEGLIRDGETWALVDELSIRVAGPIAAADPEAGSCLDRWSTDECFWLRRASMLALLTSLRKGGGDWPRFCRYAESMLGEREFFIRKAIGWVARDTSRKRPELVRAWVDAHRAGMSGLTLREATKHLPPA